MPDRAARRAAENHSTDEIEITPEMIEAGVGFVLEFRWDRHDAEDVAAKIYKAMWLARPQRR
jgi:hypothetical protein